MPEVRHLTTSQRARASTATTQHAAGGQWSKEDLHKPKHMRNASEVSTVTVTLEAGKKSFSSESSTTTLVESRRRSSSRNMQQDVNSRRRADIVSLRDALHSCNSSLLQDNTDREAKQGVNAQGGGTRPTLEGRTLDQLIDRLLERPSNESDAKYMSNFLCLYRKFAAPSQAIACVLQKFNETSQDRSTPHLVRLAKQLRTLAILVHWISEFPGDFAHPTTSLNLHGFAKSIVATPEFAYSSRELISQLENLKPDEDTDWACSDRGRGRASTAASFSSVPSLQISLPTAAMEDLALSPSQESMASALTAPDELFKAQWSSSALKKPGSRHSETSSLSSSMMEKDASGNGSTPNLYDPYDIAQRHANMLLQPTRKPLTKEMWDEFMNFDDDVVAKELTRIDWVMFSAVRPRDLIRHISLSGEERASCKGIENIDRMIAHFNHVASWIGQMILLRGKPRHRARMLEKCMEIAWKLRQMNNYNGVGAFVAGIGNVAISRLHQTRALVDQVVIKRFMRLEILMGMSKGYFAYRLAWDNTTGEKIPFLPLHRHDLVVAEEATETFVDPEKTLVNWNKFDAMGRTLWDIQKSQRMTYSCLQRNADVQRLIMEGRVGDDVDDLLYDKSVELEPPASSEGSRRRSGWLR